MLFSSRCLSETLYCKWLYLDVNGSPAQKGRGLSFYSIGLEHVISCSYEPVVCTGGVTLKLTSSISVWIYLVSPVHFWFVCSVRLESWSDKRWNVLLYRFVCTWNGFDYTNLKPKTESKNVEARPIRWLPFLVKEKHDNLASFYF